MAIKISNSTIIDDSRNIVNAGITTIASLSIGSTQVISSNLSIQNVSSLGVTGVATVNSDFTVNGNTFYVNAVNNRVGIGTTNPTQLFQVGTNFTPIVIDNMGELGIRTTNPIHPLHINSRANLVTVGIITNVTVGVTTTVISGISTSGLRTGLDVIAVSDVIASGTTVTGIGSTSITLGTATLNGTQQTGIALTFAARNDGNVVVVTGTGSIGIGTTNPNSKLQVNGDISLDDGGSFTTTLQTITPTANRTISLPDATGTVALVAGSSGQLLWNNAGANAGVTNSTVDSSGNVTIGSRFISSANAAVSTTGIAGVPAAVTGTWFTSGGTATTTKPQFLIEPTGTTSTAWSTAGTGLGVNAPSGFTGNLLDLQVNGTSQAKFDSAGSLIFRDVVGEKIVLYTSYAIGLTSFGLTFRTDGGDANNPSAVFRSTPSGVPTECLRLLLHTTQAGIRLGRDGDTFLLRDNAANTLAQRNGTSAQTFRLYNTYTSATNFELGKLEWSGNVFRIGTEKGSGGGTARALELQTDGITRLSLGATTGSETNLVNSASLLPAKSFVGTWITGQGTTNTKPHVLIEPTGTTSTSWSNSGTGLGVNAPSGFTGNLLDLQVNGTSRMWIASDGYLNHANTGFQSGSVHIFRQSTNEVARIGAAQLSVPRDIPFAWTSSATSADSALRDLIILRDAADTLAQRRTTNAQTFRCYGTFTDASNYVRAALSSTSTAVTLAAETAGTGADDIPLNLTAAGTGTVKVNSVAEVAASSTVAGLPTTPVVGMITRVTDANAPAVGSTVVGGGSAAALVWYNGASWSVIGV